MRDSIVPVVDKTHLPRLEDFDHITSGNLMPPIDEGDQPSRFDHSVEIERI